MIKIKKIKAQELLTIKGGINLTGTLLNYLTKGFNAILEAGRALGSSIRRIGSGSICKFWYKKEDFSSFFKFSANKGVVTDKVLWYNVNEREGRDFNDKSDRPKR